jgi:hypothetical protein
VKLSLEASFKDAARWIEEKTGTSQETRRTPRRTPSKAPAKSKRIQYPAELVTGTEATWKAFAEKRGLTFPAVHAAVHAGFLRFTVVKGNQCFVITDEARKSGEIRRIDGKEFHSGKVYGLPGVDKSWLIGASWLPETSKKTPILLCEGSTDFLAAWNAYSIYRRADGQRSWLPTALLGASGKKLHSAIPPLLKGRLVRLIPDGDEAGAKMGEHWGAMLSSMGCTAELVELPEGRDLRDMLESGEIKPGELYS